jgi:hypothetical protein
MTAEFNWWLLLLGLVVGGGLTWLVLADTRRREQDLEDDELPHEAAWLEARMAEEGRPLPAETLERVIQLHRAYLASTPSDEPSEDPWPAEERESPSVHEDVPASKRTPPPAPTDETSVRHEVRGG